MAIAFGRSAAASNGTATSSGVSFASLGVTVTINAGETATLVFVSSQSTAQAGAFPAVTGITNGGSWSQKVAPVRSGSFQVEIWSTEAGAALAASSVSVASTGSGDTILALVAAYTGVLGIGATATATGNTGTSTIARTTQDANNYVIAGHGSATANAASALTGSLRQTQVQSSSSTNDANAAHSDNTAVSASSVTNAVTLVATEPWAAAALELRSVAAVTSAPWSPPAIPLKRSIPFDALYRAQQNFLLYSQAAPSASVLSTIFRRFFEDGGKGGSRGSGPH